jgi:uncharacterized protein YacL
MVLWLIFTIFYVWITLYLIFLHKNTDMKLSNESINSILAYGVGFIIGWLIAITICCIWF